MIKKLDYAGVTKDRNRRGLSYDFGPVDLFISQQLIDVINNSGFRFGNNELLSAENVHQFFGLDMHLNVAEEIIKLGKEKERSKKSSQWDAPSYAGYTTLNTTAIAGGTLTTQEAANTSAGLRVGEAPDGFGAVPEGFGAVNENADPAEVELRERRLREETRQQVYGDGAVDRQDRNNRLRARLGIPRRDNGDDNG